MATDFFDDDLAEPVGADYAPSSKRSSDAAGESYHARRKKDLPEAQAVAGDEIERLRMRQQELEKRKQEIIDQRHRIDLLEKNKADLLEKLRRNGVLVVRQGEQASRAAAICHEAGSSFSRLHQEIESINPDSWDEVGYEANLIDAIAKVDSATTEYRAAMDRVAAVEWKSSSGPLPDSAEFDSRGTGGHPRGFIHWLVAGFAFTLPLIIVLFLLALLFGWRHAGL